MLQFETSKTSRFRAILDIVGSMCLDHSVDRLVCRYLSERDLRESGRLHSDEIPFVGGSKDFAKVVSVISVSQTYNVVFCSAEFDRNS